MHGMERKEWKNGGRRRQTARRGQGSVILIAALSITVLMGFSALAVDYGVLVNDKNRLQRACDAAALAGASQLKLTGSDNVDTANARTMAVITAAQNGVTVDSNAVTFNTTANQISVPAILNRSLYFARAIGITNGKVAAVATAGVKAGDRLITNNVVPIGITWETYRAHMYSRAPYNISLVRPAQQTIGMDDFVVFDLRSQNSKSPTHMMRQLIGDANDMAKLGDYETTLDSGSLEKKFQDGVEVLFDRASKQPWFDASATPMVNAVGVRFNDILAGSAPLDNPRLMHIIITPATSITHSGTYDTQVQGFAPVYLEAVREVTQGGQNVLQMQVRFLPPTYGSDGQYEAGPGILPDGTPVALSGVRIISLLN